MAKVLISELENDALNWAVAKAKGYKFVEVLSRGSVTTCTATGIVKHEYDTDLAQSGQIMDEYGISTILHSKEDGRSVWAASSGQTKAGYTNEDVQYKFHAPGVVYGPSRSIAGMRCFVELKTQQEWIDVPDALFERVEQRQLERQRD